MAKKEEMKTKETAVSYYEGVGRRKEGTARVRLYVTEDEVSMKGSTIKKGDIQVNGRPFEKYFPTEIAQKLCLEPFRITNTLGRFAVSVVVVGGGPMGQLNAFIHGVSRALLKADKEKFRPILKKRGFLTRDPRAKQRRKAGYAQKARARKQSPKR